MSSPEHDNIIQLEVINGTSMYLGRMSVEQLDVLAEHARARVLDAQTDLWILEQYKTEALGEVDGTTAS